jgi:hypothetical protein
MKLGIIHINAVTLTTAAARSRACFDLIEILTKLTGEFTIPMTVLQIGSGLL